MTALYEQVAIKLGFKTPFTLSKTQDNSQIIKESPSYISTLGLTNGQLLYTAHKEIKPEAPKPKYIKHQPIDEYLLKQKGTIKRPRNPQFCKHGDQGMCEYCLPLQPYDKTYLEENKIKHMSFHSYLREIVENNKVPVAYDPLFIPPLDIPNYKVLDPCPSGHEPYPISICSKCQPSAITLQTQNFRMVDHVEFEIPSIIDNFLQFWRGSGNQRFGFLFGRYEPYDVVPLGIKAVVSVIYEPNQSSAHDFIQLEEDRMDVDSIASKLGLERIGIVYTDLFDDGTGKGTVICKRHADSYFLSSAEIIFSAALQNQNPIKTIYSPTGEFGSRFVTCVISGICS